MQGLWAKTAASGFRMTAGTPSGRYGLPFGNRDSLRSNHPPPAGASLRAGVMGCFPCGGEGDLRGVRRPRCVTTALCRESGKCRRPKDRTTAFSLFHYGMAVTAGAGPQTVRKDASRRGRLSTHRRPASFSLESRPVSFSAEKEMDLAPAAGSRPPGGQPPPGAPNPRPA